jgi:putative acetyltransferase
MKTADKPIKPLLSILCFIPSTRFGVGCEYEAPEEAFMVVELQPDYLRGKSGTIKYHAAFKNV